MSINRQKLNQKFLQEYEKLNEQQRAAVDRLDGPVMVIAGPGTGKTQILASRIGKILLDTDAAPENIICLTYTEAGVVAMRKRLLQFIGPDAYKVAIYTFHAFCNDVIQENLSLFEKTALDPISDLEKIELFKELIDTLPKNHPLKRYRGDVYFEIKYLQKLFSDMKQEGWSPSYINRCIDEYIMSLPTRDDFIYKRKSGENKPGDLKKDKLNEETEKMEKLRAAVNEFDRFQQMMRARNRYDFDDMINWVIRAFEENKSLLANYQERYQYILVDEYQDTSGTQNRIVELLISYWDKPNVFVVGDDDQSIYRFQGANVENMEQFMKKYSDLLVVVLEKNYRSIQPILDVSKSLIQRNEERLIHKSTLNLTKELIASNEKINQLTHPPIITQYETERDEMIGIASTVQKLINENTDPGKIAIIYRENKYGEELARYFKLLNIPVYSKRQQNILEMPLAQKILLLMRYLAAEHDIPYGGDEMLFEILHFDWFGIPPVEIAKLSVEVADKQFSENKTSLRRLLQEKAHAVPRDLFSQGLPENMKKASRVLEKLIGDVPNITLQQLFENIIREAGVLGTIMQSHDKHYQLQVLTALFDFIRDETHRNPLMDLKGLIAIIELMEKEKISLPLMQVSGSDKGVNLLTAHGSKGLEFEWVFVAGCVSASWEKKRAPAGGYSLPDTIFEAQPKKKEEEELRRLFYVALTRAEKFLLLSYSRFRNDNKSLEPSMFIAEIQEQHPDIVLTPGTITPDELLTFSSLQFLETAPEIDKLEEDFVSRLLEKFVMNVTALNNYLRCPLDFYFKNLIRIPSPKNEATEFGSSIHYALEQLFRKMTEHPKNEFHSKEQFIADFEWYMRRHRESFTKEQFDRRLEYGHDVLSNYYDKYIGQFNKIVSIERTIRGVVINGVPLKGKLDKLEFDGKSVNVVDYKTGDPDKALAKLKGPNEKDPNGGDYWRQAVFYKILVDNYSQKDWTAMSTEFDFIEPDKKKKYRKEKVVISPPDITTVSQQIQDTWQRIQARDFYTGCGKEDCHWCEFVKTNNMAIALHEIEQEEEEERL
jgi:DNA helicase II / ATP-dependent DNA helicase PcrA